MATENYILKPTPKTLKRLGTLKALLSDKRSLLIILQDNPDPDAIGAAMALRELAHDLASANCTIAHGGRIGRAENRALVKYLNMKLRPLDQVDIASYGLLAMVDTQPGTGNNSLPEDIPVDIVIDHHPLRPKTRRAGLIDIRRSYGATATILLEYLLAANIVVDRSLATALVYAIRSDTQDLGRDASRADIQATQYLYPYANLKMLSTIQRGQVDRSYFRYLETGLHSARIYDNCIITSLGRIDNPDMIGEIADILLRDEQAEWTLCQGIFGNRLLLSLRTIQPDISAEKMMRSLVARVGTGGGHQMMAGGQIPIRKDTQKEIVRLEKFICKKLCTQLNILPSVGKAIVNGCD